MGSKAGVVGSSMRWLLAFTVVLLVSSAVPVLAEEPAEVPPELGETSSVTPPTEAQVQEGLEEVERREADRLQELQTPAFVEAREESRDAFTDLSNAEAQVLLHEAFPSELADLNADPARYLSDVALLRSYGESGGTVLDEGDGLLLETEIPLRTEDAGGDLAKVDVSLDPVADGFEPVNPLTELHVPDTSTEPIEVGENGLAITPVGGEEATAQSFGEKNVWFADAEIDTDLMVSTTAAGVELFDQLRSAESPETLHFRLDLPEGAEVRENGGGGADISKGGEVFAFMPPPSAVDAQGTPVPVELEIEGQEITLHAPHRSGDFAYPILIDPAINENWGAAWYYGTNNEAIDKPGIWGYNTNDPTEAYILHKTSCLSSGLCSPSGRGLFISTLNKNIPANTWAHWYYNVPGGTTYIPSIYPQYSANLDPFWRNNGNCTWEKYKQPHDYDGAYDASGNWVYLEEDRAQWYGNASIFTKAKGIAFGMSSGGGVNIPCWRNIMLGGTVIYLDDPEAPTLSSVTGVPTTWVSDTTQFTVTANASDPGLGVQNVTMAPAGTAIRYFTVPQSQCPGIKTKPCPASTASQLVANGTLFDEGEKGVNFSVYDPTGKTSNTIGKTIRVDRTPPEVTLAGQLAMATKEDKGDAQDPAKWDTLPLPTYNLKIEATDGATTSGATKRSGVKSIAVYLDENKTPAESWEQTCPASSCAMTKTYPLKVSGLSMGKHTLEVKVKDQVGKERVRNIEFEYFPATGMKDDYVMHHFPLGDGQGSGEEGEDSGPELAVNVMNGNLVYREQDVDVEGSSSIDLEVERYYNSQLPDSANTEWGDGWTLAEAPQLDPEDTGGAPAPDAAELVDSTGAIENGVGLPEGTVGEQFDPQLQGTLIKTAEGYELRDETGESATTVAFNESGQTEELQAGKYTSVDYDYKGGDLSEIAVDDPGSAGGAVEVKFPNSPAAYNPRYSNMFGSLGSGDGQVSAPSDVARDAKGNLWIIDKGNNRIEKFNAKGEYVSKFGSSGSGNGQFNKPTAIAIDAQGNLWVVDAGNSRVQKFSEAGAFLLKFGSKGTGNGQFGGEGPFGVAIDNQGDIWVSDTFNGRLQEFSPTGAFQRVVGSKGSGEGQLGYPAALDVGPEGNVWVADWLHNRVSVFTGQADEVNPAGQFVRQFGSFGEGEGQFNHPDAIDIDDNGNVWVSDIGNGRVQRFTVAGEYRAEFGSKGSGQAQFNFTYPMGIASSPTGDLWITDVSNNRIQKWAIPPEVPVYSSSVGTFGSENGQFKYPTDVAIDAEENFLVADKGNSRVQKFNAKGEYVSQFGGYGSTPGKFETPASIAIDPKGDIWVTDRSTSRVSRFLPSGVFGTRYGSPGSGASQFNKPEGIAIDDQGTAWIADRLNGRLQRISSNGAFPGPVSSKGSSPGQLGEPTAIDIGPEGYAWVTDWQNNRVAVFTTAAGEGGGQAGQFVRQFGTAGTGPGQFNRPDAIDVDAEGNVWVGDQNNNRVQLFNRNGEYITEFGAKGSGPGQFKFAEPFGITTDDQGGIWVTDPNNHRVQEWLISSRLRIEDDPAVDVSTSAGLIETVEGEEAGEHSYDHDGDKLVSHDGPQGETEYSYDSAGHLAGIVLPDGTSALIVYNGGYGRVSSVTVDLAGQAPAKTTEFTYSDEPRRTVVIPPDAPHVTYDIGEDGSVLKWWNTLQPPSIDDLSGSLYFDREKSEPISIGDHNLVAQAHSEEGIASIQFIANGNVLVDEMKCDKPQVIECKTLLNEWVTETGAHSPGILNLEVITTDRLGGTESKRFWVNIPYTPPEPPGAKPAPKFKDIKQFREEYGLEVVFPVANELELNDRIFDLIGAWHNPQTPAGEVARASWERWGVPMRAVDVAEMEYREWFYNVNAERIDQWVQATNPSSYAGYYLDHASGGIMHVGFTNSQAEQLESLKASLPLVAGERLQVYSTTPTASYRSVQEASQSVSSAIESNSTLDELVISVKDDEAGKAVRVGTTNVSQVEGILNQIIGPNAPVVVEYDAGGGSPLSGRWRNNGRMRAGDFIVSRHYGYPQGVPVHDGNQECTAGFGAKDKAGEVRGDIVWRLFVLTAGHCTGFEVYAKQVFRSTDADLENETHWREVGSVARDGYTSVTKKARTDAEAIRVNGSDIVPQGIFGWSGDLIPTGQAGKARIGNVLCFSGVKTQVPQCGRVVARSTRWTGSDGVARGGYWVKFRTPATYGDSGAPVWSRTPGSPSIGQVTAGRPLGIFTETLVEPLLHPYNMASDVVPGILDDPLLRPLSLKHR